MKTFLALIVIALGLSGAAAVTHTLQYFYTASSGIPGFPEFINLGMLDGVQMDYYDSNIKKVIPKQDWMAKTEGPEYWDRQTQVSIGTEETFKANIVTAKQRFNQTGGVHIWQKMYGCEWDDETDEVNAFNQFGYDGEDFVAFDLKTDTFIAPTPQALITKHKWDNNKAYVAQKKEYCTRICPEWLKKYVKYGKSSLMRTVPPSVSLLQKTPASPVSCHATGFYPNRAEMIWRKNGEELHEGVVKGEILPNNDGTFQISADMDFSAIASEDWSRYDCVFQLSGVNNDVVTKLDKAVIKTNEGSSGFPIGGVVGGVVVGGLVLCITIGVFIYFKKRNNGFKRANTSDTSSSSSSEGSNTKKEPIEEQKMMKSTA